MAIVLYASTSAGSAEMSAKILQPFWLRLFPWLAQLVDVDVLNIAVRKTGHAVQFFIFALLIWRGVRLSPPWPVGRKNLCLATLGASAVLALLSEGIQWFYRERGASLGDVGLDMLGAFLGAWIIWLLDPRLPTKWHL